MLSCGMKAQFIFFFKKIIAIRYDDDDHWLNVFPKELFPSIQGNIRAPVSPFDFFPPCHVSLEALN
eukprot:m.31219 g.31219  ORF g.31219 m.31219 type:complete len:66 (+) comp14718_c0_seq2:1802-1999(+)